MSERQDAAVLPDLEAPRPANRRQFLGRTAVAAVAAAGIPSLLAACGESSTGPTQAAAPSAAGAAPGLRPSLSGGRNFGQTVNKMVTATIGTASDCKVPALEKGITTTYLQRIITDNDRTGTGLATVLKGVVQSPSGVTVQVVVQNSFGRNWAPRTIGKQADLAYAMKDAMATNPNFYGVHRQSLTAGSSIISISKSSIVQFQDSVASDIYGNHNDIFARGMCDLFSPSVAGYPIASTVHDPLHC